MAVCGRTGALDLVLAVILAGERDLLVGAVVEREAAVGEGLVRFGVARAVVQRLLTAITINNGTSSRTRSAGVERSTS
jgi:hypothetical protein